MGQASTFCNRASNAFSVLFSGATPQIDPLNGGHQAQKQISSTGIKPVQAYKALL
ncbi:MAG: hypothetical protein JJ891_08995 [Rhizobiaceae bacterium]|nr:hypothetical protein [Rhizobiaceae bacterium]